jgi:hypothetical protein
MHKLANIIFDELGIIAGIITIGMVGHALIIGLSLLAYVVLHW